MVFIRWQSIILFVVIGCACVVHPMETAQVNLEVAVAWDDDTPLVFQGMHFWGIKRYHAHHPGVTHEEIARVLNIPVFIVDYVLAYPDLPQVILYDQEQGEYKVPDWTQFYDVCKQKIAQELNEKRLYGQISDEERNALYDDLAAKLGLAAEQVEPLVVAVWDTIELVVPPMPVIVRPSIVKKRRRRSTFRLTRVKRRR